MKLNEIIHQYSWHMPPSSSDPLLSSLLISGEFVLLSGWSLCQSSGWLVERVMSKQKSLFQSHVSAWFFNYFSRWRSTSQQMAHLAPLRCSARQALSWASDGEAAGRSPTADKLCVWFVWVSPARTSIKARHGLNRELPEAVVLWKQGWLLSRLQVIWALRKAFINHTRPIKWGNAVWNRGLNSCLCTVITQRRCLLLRGCSFRALAGLSLFSF